MSTGSIIQEVESMICEDWHPLDKIKKWAELAKLYEEQSRKQAAAEVLEEIALLKPNVWQWCMENLNTPFPDWKDEWKDYYQRRYSETKNPLHKARYAYILWSQEREIEYAKTTVQSFIEAATLMIERKCYLQGTQCHVVAFCYEFAASHSITLNLKAPLDVASILSHVSKVAEHLFSDEKLKGRGTYDLIHVIATLAERGSRNPMIKNNENVKKLISQILPLAVSISKEWAKEGNFRWQRSYIEDCIKFASFIDDEAEVHDFHIAVAESYVEEGRNSKSKILEQHFYAQALKIYSNLGLSEKVDELKTKISQCAQEAVARGEYKEYTVKAEIPFQEAAQNYVDKLEGKPSEILAIIANDTYLFSSKAKVKQYVKQLSQKYIFAFMFPQMIMGTDGPIEVFNTPEEILEYKFREHYNFESQGNEIFIMEVFHKLLEKNKAKPQDIFNFVTAGGNIDENVKKIFEAGLKAHFEKNYVCSVSTFVPQVEQILRELLRNHGKTPTKYDQRKGGIEQTLLRTLIDDAEPIVGEDFAEYLRIRLTTAFANIRNDVCHGWLPFEEYTESLSFALIYTILKLCNT
jgi:hypothetical protein